VKKRLRTTVLECFLQKGRTTVGWTWWRHRVLNG